LGVVAVGVVVVALVPGLQLVPRLSAGQRLVDAAKPAMTEEAVAGEVAATNVLAHYVDLADPLMTQKGGASDEVETLVTMIKRRTGVSARRARLYLRREAPRTEALLRAIPFTALARERGELTAFLSSTLNITPDQLQDELARSFPRIYQTLVELGRVTSGWRDVPGIEGLERFDGKTPVRTMPELRDYLDDDLVGTVEEQRDHFGALAGWGGIGYIPLVLLVAGIFAIGFGLLHARWSADHASGRVAWGAVAALGILLMLFAGALLPRLRGGETMIRAFEPAFEDEQVTGLRAGNDFVLQAVRFGDPLLTPRGGAADEVPRLVALVSGQAGLSEAQVRGRLKQAAPRTFALLEAIPLSGVEEEVPKLVASLSRKLGLPGDRLVRTLRKRTPGLAQALLAVGPVTSEWDRVQGTEGLKRFDGLAPVRSVPQFAGYLDQDVVPLFEAQGANFDELANTWPRVDVLPAVVAGVGLLLALYGVAMLFLATPQAFERRRRRARTRSIFD